MRIVSFGRLFSFLLAEEAMQTSMDLRSIYMANGVGIFILLNHIANTYLFSINLILPFCVPILLISAIIVTRRYEKEYGVRAFFKGMYMMQ